MAIGDSLNLSALPAQGGGMAVAAAGAAGKRGQVASGAASPSTGKSTAGDSLELSPEAQQLVAKLKATDQRVRAHEAAHLSVAGGLARGGANYTYTTGPDGKRYAIGGEVSIDTSAVPGNPQATLARARQVEAAALAPADPSGQDHAVAAQAAAMASQAALELSRQRTAGASDSRSSGRILDVTA